MKTIGLIGGMSWESTAHYYRLLNQDVRQRLGGHHSAKILLASVDFHEVEHCQRTGDWPAAARLLVEHARRLETAGADVLLIGANTMHKVAPDVADAVGIPLLHVAEVTGDALQRQRCARPALLGTRFTMEEPFYRDRLVLGRELSVLTPAPLDRESLHRIIYDELCQGKLLPASRETLRRLILDLVARGADSVILGCTELGLLLSPADSPVPCFDTTVLHARAAVDFALA